MPHLPFSMLEDKLPSAGPGMKVWLSTLPCAQALFQHVFLMPGLAHPKIHQPRSNMSHSLLTQRHEAPTESRQKYYNVV